MKVGESKFRTGALHFEKDTCPALHRFTVFQEHPSKKNLDEFVTIAKQDFGIRAAEAFGTWGSGLFETPANAPDAPKNIKPFEVRVKDGLYDCFKAAQIPLGPTQVEALERASLRLANSFQAEISRTVLEQLKILVEKIKEKKPPEVPAAPVDSNNV